MPEKSQEFIKNFTTLAENIYSEKGRGGIMDLYPVKQIVDFLLGDFNLDKIPEKYKDAAEKLEAQLSIALRKEPVSAQIINDILEFSGGKTTFGMLLDTMFTVNNFFYKNPHYINDIMLESLERIKAAEKRPEYLRKAKELEKSLIKSMNLQNLTPKESKFLEKEIENMASKMNLLQAALKNFEKFVEDEGKKFENGNRLNRGQVLLKNLQKFQKSMPTQ